MPTTTLLAEIKAQIEERPFVIVKAFEHTPADNYAEVGLPDSLRTLFADFGTVQLKWDVDQVESYAADFDWIDSGMDAVRGGLNTADFPKRFADNNWGPPMEWTKQQLGPQPEELVVLDNGAPNYMALLKVQNGEVVDRVWLLDAGLADFHSHPRLLDMGIGVGAYLAYALSCAGYWTWQRALMGTEHFPADRPYQRWREQIRHYLPQLFPSLANGKLMEVISAA